MDNQVFPGGAFMDEHPQICTLCGVLFNNAMSLQHHMQLHILSNHQMIGNQPPDPGLGMPPNILELIAGASQHGIPSSVNNAGLMANQSLFTGAQVSNVPSHLISQGHGLPTAPLPTVPLPQQHQQPSNKGKQKKSKLNTPRTSTHTSMTNTSSTGSIPHNSSSFKSRDSNSTSSTYISTFPKEIEDFDLLSSKKSHPTRITEDHDIFPQQSSIPIFDPLEEALKAQPSSFTKSSMFDRHSSSSSGLPSSYDTSSRVKDTSNKLFQPFVKDNEPSSHAFVSKPGPLFTADSIITPMKIGLDKPLDLDMLSSQQKYSRNKDNMSLHTSPNVAQAQTSVSSEQRHIGRVKQQLSLDSPHFDSTLPPKTMAAQMGRLKSQSSFDSAQSFSRGKDMTKSTSVTNEGMPLKSQFYPCIMDPLNISPKMSVRDNKDLEPLTQLPMHSSQFATATARSVSSSPDLKSNISASNNDILDSALVPPRMSPKISTDIPCTVIDSSTATVPPKVQPFGVNDEIITKGSTSAAIPQVFGNTPGNPSLGIQDPVNPLVPFSNGTGYLNALTQKFINPGLPIGADFNKPSTSSGNFDGAQKGKVYFENGNLISNDYDKISDSGEDDDDLDRLIFDGIDAKVDPIGSKDYSVEDLLNEINEHNPDDVKSKQQMDDFLDDVLTESTKLKVDTAKTDSNNLTPDFSNIDSKFNFTEILEKEIEIIDKESKMLESARLKETVDLCRDSATPESVVSQPTSTGVYTAGPSTSAKDDGNPVAREKSSASDKRKEEDAADFDIPKVGKLNKIRKYFQIQEQKKKEQTQSTTATTTTTVSQKPTTVGTGVILTKDGEIRIREKEPVVEEKPQTILVQVSKRKKIEYGPYINRQSLLEGKPKQVVPEKVSPPKVSRPKPKPPAPVAKRTFNLRDRKTKTDFASLASKGSKTPEVKKKDEKAKSAEKNVSQAADIEEKEAVDNDKLEETEKIEEIENKEEIEINEKTPKQATKVSPRNKNKSKKKTPQTSKNERTPQTSKTVSDKQEKVINEENENEVVDIESVEEPTKNVVENLNKDKINLRTRSAKTETPKSEPKNLRKRANRTPTEAPLAKASKVMENIASEDITDKMEELDTKTKNTTPKIEEKIAKTKTQASKIEEKSTKVKTLVSKVDVTKTQPESTKGDCDDTDKLTINPTTKVEERKAKAKHSTVKVEETVAKTKAQSKVEELLVKSPEAKVEETIAKTKALASKIEETIAKRRSSKANLNVPIETELIIMEKPILMEETATSLKGEETINSDSESDEKCAIIGVPNKPKISPEKPDIKKCSVNLGENLTELKIKAATYMKKLEDREEHSKSEIKANEEEPEVEIIESVENNEITESIRNNKITESVGNKMVKGVMKGLRRGKGKPQKVEEKVDSKLEEKMETVDEIHDEMEILVGNKMVKGVMKVLRRSKEKIKKVEEKVDYKLEEKMETVNESHDELEISVGNKMVKGVMKRLRRGKEKKKKVEEKDDSKLEEKMETVNESQDETVNCETEKQVTIDISDEPQEDNDETINEEKPLSNPDIVKRTKVVKERRRANRGKRKNDRRTALEKDIEEIFGEVENIDENLESEVIENIEVTDQNPTCGKFEINDKNITCEVIIDESESDSPENVIKYSTNVNSSETILEKSEKRVTLKLKIGRGMAKSPITITEREPKHKKRKIHGHKSKSKTKWVVEKDISDITDNQSQEIVYKPQRPGISEVLETMLEKKTETTMIEDIEITEYLTEETNIVEDFSEVVNTVENMSEDVQIVENVELQGKNEMDTSVDTIDNIHLPKVKDLFTKSNSKLEKAKSKKSKAKPNEKETKIYEEKETVFPEKTKSNKSKAKPNEKETDMYEKEIMLPEKTKSNKFKAKPNEKESKMYEEKETVVTEKTKSNKSKVKLNEIETKMSEEKEIVFPEKTKSNRSKAKQNEKETEIYEEKENTKSSRSKAKANEKETEMYEEKETMFTEKTKSNKSKAKQNEKETKMYEEKETVFPEKTKPNRSKAKPNEKETKTYEEKETKFPEKTKSNRSKAKSNEKETNIYEVKETVLPKKTKSNKSKAKQNEKENKIYEEKETVLSKVDREEEKIFEKDLISIKMKLDFSKIDNDNVTLEIKESETVKDLQSTNDLSQSSIENVNMEKDKSDIIKDVPSEMPKRDKLDEKSANVNEDEEEDISVLHRRTEAEIMAAFESKIAAKIESNSKAKKRSVENEFQRLVDEAMAEVQKAPNAEKQEKNLRKRLNDAISYNMDDSDDEMDLIRLHLLPAKNPNTPKSKKNAKNSDTSKKSDTKVGAKLKKDQEIPKPKKEVTDIYDFTDTEMSDKEEDKPSKLSFKPKYVSNVKPAVQTTIPLVSTPIPSPAASHKSGTDNEKTDTEETLDTSNIGQTVQPLKIKLNKIIPYKEKKHKHKKKKKKKDRDRKTESEHDQANDNDAQKSETIEIIEESSDSDAAVNVGELESSENTTTVPNASPTGSGSTSNSNSKKPKIKEKKHICIFCSQGFWQKCDLRKHIMIHTGERPWPCSVCNKAFQRKTDLVKHTRTHTGEKPYACEFCDKRVSDKSQLNVHRRLHTGDRPYQCTECGKGCITSSALSRHRALHCQEKLHECILCKKTFKVKECYGLHMKMHYKSRVRLLKCKTCSLGFDSSSDLEKHECVMSPTHYTCFECYEEFTDEDVYGTHVKTHDLNIFSCNMCTKLFEDKSSLETHLCTLGVAEKVKTITCDVCDEAFMDQDSLSKHLPIHDTSKHDRPFSCNTCSEVLTSKKDMKSHVCRKQLNKMVVKCETCGEIYDESNASVHERNCHVKAVVSVGEESQNKKGGVGVSGAAKQPPSFLRRCLSGGPDQKKKGASQGHKEVVSRPEHITRASVISGSFRNSENTSYNVTSITIPMASKMPLKTENEGNEKMFESSEFTNSPDFSLLTDDNDLNIPAFTGNKMASNSGKAKDRNAKNNSSDSSQNVRNQRSVHRPHDDHHAKNDRRQSTQPQHTSQRSAQSSPDFRWSGYQISATDYVNSLLNKMDHSDQNTSLNLSLPNKLYESAIKSESVPHSDLNINKTASQTSAHSSQTSAHRMDSYKDNIENQSKSDMFPDFDFPGVGHSPNRPTDKSALPPKYGGENTNMTAFQGIDQNLYNLTRNRQHFQEKSDMSSYSNSFLSTYPQGSINYSNSANSNLFGSGNNDVNKRVSNSQMFPSNPDIMQNSYFLNVEDSIKGTSPTDKTDETTALLSNFDYGIN